MNETSFVSIPRSELLAQARKMLVGQPKKIRGECSCVDGVRTEGRFCIEPHLLGPIGKVPTWTGSDALYGETGTLYGHWDIHAKQYRNLYAYFPIPLGGGESIDLMEALDED